MASRPTRSPAAEPPDLSGREQPVDPARGRERAATGGEPALAVARVDPGLLGGPAARHHVGHAVLGEVADAGGQVEAATSRRTAALRAPSRRRCPRTSHSLRRRCGRPGPGARRRRSRRRPSSSCSRPSRSDSVRCVAPKPARAVAVVDVEPLGGAVAADHVVAAVAVPVADAGELVGRGEPLAGLGRRCRSARRRRPGSTLVLRVERVRASRSALPSPVTSPTSVTQVDAGQPGAGDRARGEAGLPAACAARSPAWWSCRAAPRRARRCRRGSRCGSGWRRTSGRPRRAAGSAGSGRRGTCRARGLADVAVPVDRLEVLLGDPLLGGAGADAVQAELPGEQPARRRRARRPAAGRSRSCRSPTSRTRRRCSRACARRRRDGRRRRTGPPRSGRSGRPGSCSRRRTSPCDCVW